MFVETNIVFVETNIVFVETNVVFIAQQKSYLYQLPPVIFMHYSRVESLPFSVG